MTIEAKTQAQRLDARLLSAVVTETEQGVYEVFVPGAIREITTVKASSEKEAIKKVRANLIEKMEYFDNKEKLPAGNSDGELQVQGGKHANDSDVAGEA